MSRPIETSFHEGKAHGVGEARNRVQRAVEQTVPFGFLCQKQTVSYRDMLAALRRDLIRAEFHPQAPSLSQRP